MSDEEIEELREEVTELQQENQKLNALVSALQKKVSNLEDIVVGENRDTATDTVEESLNIFDRVNEIEQEMDEMSRTARAAVAASDARADGSGPTKKELAMKEGRNKLVTNAATSTAKKQKIKFARIQDNVDKTDVRYQTVKDAANELVAKWDAIEKTKDESGEWVLTLQENEISKELVYVVENDLGRDDLTKRLISGNGRRRVK